ncbi:phosphoglycolate phosphatase-like HAD superfamily hydrolase [Micromonospora pisi]|uniref:Phosphoglycolate phosphatase-like HAD superfamily hydrolase n=1 Tax=Micromonospora pisi TaxID=589240 RepID=A0A495JR97_9ACTN|nr:HAD family hydrolase [Micromonospora pisi]RKR91493.1 phosphoglycolate phosphatase-like HAD superfamily hydrolase [Micromonospora pisi]
MEIDRPAGVLFDVDGTLVDTAYLHTVSWWEALRQAEQEIPMAAIHRALGMGPQRLLEHLLGPERDRDADERIRYGHDSLFAEFRDRLRPLPGAAALLRACAARGLAVVLVTSADERELSALRAALLADDVIGGITSAGADLPPGADLLATALDRAGLDRERVVFVGDSVWDVAAAGHLDIPCIGLTCGGTGRSELAGAGAAAVFDDPAALLAGLADSPVAALA